MDFARVSHGPTHFLWLVQGNKTDEWFTARTWQQLKFNEFYASQQESLDFQYLAISYRIQFVHLGRLMILKNLGTGMVRLVHGCVCPVYSHLGSTVHSVSLLQNGSEYKVDTDSLGSIVRDFQECTVSPAPDVHAALLF